MGSAAPFRGVFAAMVTPFTDDGRALSETRLRAYCDFLIDKGVSGLFAFGTTGEWPLLAESERASGSRIIVQQVRKRVPVIAHVGAHETGQVIRLAVEAREAGVDAVSLVSPPFFSLDDDALFDHFTAVARAVAGLPVFLYNIPEFAGNDISPQLFLRVAGKADNVIGLKHSGDSLARILEYRRAMGAGFSLFNGNDSLALPALHEGVDGLVSGNASTRPELLVALYALFHEGKHGEAAQKQRVLDDFIASLDSSCELSSLKALLALRGMPVGDVRLPLKHLGSEGREALRRLLP
ncbi:MAG: dihydrodipicolinate synthase family protein [Spirochaetes bacterium]|nr:dihydrodipicolinate synthase family protein [Spirochaetota bacterium]